MVSDVSLSPRQLPEERVYLVVHSANMSQQCELVLGPQPSFHFPPRRRYGWSRALSVVPGRKNLPSPVTQAGGPCAGSSEVETFQLVSGHASSEQVHSTPGDILKRLFMVVGITQKECSPPVLSGKYNE